LRSIQEQISEEFIVAPTWARNQNLVNLERQADNLTGKLWRDLSTVWNPQLKFPGKLFAGAEHLPPPYVTQRWVAQQQELSRQVEIIKGQFAAWKFRKEPVYG